MSTEIPSYASKYHKTAVCHSNQSCHSDLSFSSDGGSRTYDFPSRIRSLVNQDQCPAVSCYHYCKIQEGMPPHKAHSHLSSILHGEGHFCCLWTPGTAYSLKHESSMPLSYMSLQKWIQDCLCINQHRIIQTLETNNFWKRNVANQDRLSYPGIISWRSCKKPPIIITKMVEDPSWFGGNRSFAAVLAASLSHILIKYIFF